MSGLRRFLDQRGLLEVQTPLLTSRPALETEIEPFSCGPEGPYLISSPEYAMKRLLAQGSGSIYQIGSVFRQGEVGYKHNPEFTLLEFYLVGQDHWGLMDFLAELFEQVLDWPKPLRQDYGELFSSRLGLDPYGFTFSQFRQTLAGLGQEVPEFLLEANPTDQLDYLFGLYLEPKLGLDRPVFLTGYPAFMSALARLEPDQKRSARFEVFYQGFELGNGFYELKDPAEQRRRFEETNLARKAKGKPTYPLDEKFLAALGQMPDCAGIALGVDRILMAAGKTKQIERVMPFAWDQA